MNVKNIMIIFLIILNVLIFNKSVDIQKKELFSNGYNIVHSLEIYVQRTIDSINFINTVASDKIENSSVLIDSNALRTYENEKGVFTLDSKYMQNKPSNLKVSMAGYSGVVIDNAFYSELQMSLELAPYFKAIKEQNEHYTWIYYYSNKNFLTLYPVIESDTFRLDPDLKAKPLFQYGTPKLNPKREIFTTPLYKDTLGKGLMITMGKPVYYQDQFLGITEVDITLNILNNLLGQLDILNNRSLLINSQHQILGQHNVKGIKQGKIELADNFESLAVLEHNTTKSDLVLVGSRYVYISNIKSAEYKFIYSKNAYYIWGIALFYTLPALFLMFFIIYISSMYSKTKKLNRELTKSEEKFKKLAMYDPMTNIYNRRYFFTTGEAIFHKAVRKKSPIAVCMMDIDDFKIVNDTYGHAVGDEVIINAAKLIQTHLRQSDLFARFGGEEFCVLLEDISKEHVVELFEKIRIEFEKNNLTHKVKYTISFGIAYGEFDSLQEAITLADTALYKSKENGKNQVSLL